MDSRIRSLLVEALALDASDELNDDSGYYTLPQWDSLAQIMIAALIEQEFGVVLTVDEVAGLVDVSAVMEVVSKRRRGSG